ncbi:hypothetical protein OG244_38185 [Streptomyces brevispora]|uniref:hypothetical protein n=1 Tax=Streptomyces brevispora TaxID=887462 RepID=UPI002E2F82C2|nr:hypothetical protein [Streptomyces brevispora]
MLVLVVLPPLWRARSARNRLSSVSRLIAGSLLVSSKVWSGSDGHGATVFVSVPGE